GTNAHIVLEEAPKPERAAPGYSSRSVPQPVTPGETRLFVLSARDETTLAALANRYAAAVRECADDDLGDLCRSAAASRAHHAQRAIVFARSIAELAER